MAVTQWKIVNQLKEYYRYTADKMMYQVVNKEFARLLQKIQPSIYGEHLIRPLENNPSGSTTAVPAIRNNIENNDVKAVAEKSKDQGYTMPKVLTGWQLKIGKSEITTEAKKQKWLNKEEVVPKSVIMSRTSDITKLILGAESDESKIHRIDDLSEHLTQFPEAKHQAVKVSPFP